MTLVETMERGYIFSLGLFVLAVILIFLLKRLLAWLDRHGFITYTGHTPTYGSVGNAFLNLQATVDPGKQYVLEMREEQEEEREEDGEAGPDDPTAYRGKQGPGCRPGVD